MMDPDDIPEPTPTEMELKARKVDALPISQRDTLIETCAALVDLSPDALEFSWLVAIESERTQPFDPVVVMANALARFKALRRRN